MSKKSIIITIVIVVVVIGGLFALGLSTQNKPDNGEYNSFAQCLASKGVIFYGAFWCPHCKAQKEEFGSAVQYLPYHECSTADANGQLQSCTDAKVESYPTWVFPDGSREEGVLSLDELSQKSGCPLPASSTATSTDTGSSSPALLSATTTVQ